MIYLLNLESGPRSLPTPPTNGSNDHLRAEKTPKRCFPSTEYDRGRSPGALHYHVHVYVHLMIALDYMKEESPP